MSEILSSFHFLRPAWLLLVPVSIAIWWFWQQSIEPLRGWREQMDSDLLGALRVGDGASREASASVLLAIWILSAIAIAGPTWRREPNPFAADAEPLMILLKSSESMLLPDPAPSRLERAHLKIADLATYRQGQPLGLIAYAGSAHLVLPPTTDTQIVAEMAGEVGPTIMPVPGDRLDLAIRKASELLLRKGEGGSLLVVADSVEREPAKTDAMGISGSLPIQFLALTESESPEARTIAAAARQLDGSVQPITVDDRDIEAIARFAERRGGAGIAGESERWQEAGYWLTPVIAALVALSFRRRMQSGLEDAR